MIYLLYHVREVQGLYTMQEWEEKFDEVALHRGMALFQEGKVTGLKNTDGKVSASIATIPRYEISFLIKERLPSRMRCQCPKYRSGRNCEHLSAALYSVFGGIAPLKKKDEQRKAEQKIARQERQARLRRAIEEAAAKEAEEAAGKAAEEAEEAARRAAEKEKARRETAERIAQRDAEKKEKKAERKRKRLEAEQAARAAALEAMRRREAEERQRQDEELRQAALELERRERVKAEQAAAKEEAARRKEQKIQNAIARKAAERLTEDKEYMDRVEEQMHRSEIAASENYSYFDFGFLRRQLDLSKSSLKKGQELWRGGYITLKDASGGYGDGDDNYMVEIIGEGKAGTRSASRTFPLHLVFTRNKIYRSHCECDECKKSGYFWYGKSNCDYIAGILAAAEDYAREHNLGDATDRTGAGILHSFQDKHARQIMAGTEGREESLQLEPRLTRRENKLTLSFRVGEGKLFVVKDLFEFCRMVRESETGTYGSSTQINHQLNHFTKRSREWYRFISKVVREEEEMERRMEESMRYYYRSSKCSSLELYGWRLDQFFDELGDSAIEYEDKTEGGRKKEFLKAKESNPGICLQIRKCDLGKIGSFHGIEVSGQMPVFYHGEDTSYYVDGGALCKAQKEFMEQIQPFARQARNGRLKFRVGRKNLSEFYYSFLPRVQETVTIAEENSEEIRSYLPPEVNFLFYLDAQRGNMTCMVHALYGEKEVSVLDLLDNRGSGALESFRMESREAEMLYRARLFFPELDMERDEIHCGQDEERMYQVLEHGVEELLKYGEVKTTQRFRNVNLIRHAKVAVGVSVSQGLLNLEIIAEDISREELLDVLKGYRVHRKFYRLKNGDFLNMGSDSLEMLNEMVETLHLPVKEFVKGKIQLPAYRSLYLDKLLEENEEVYLTRDSRFREMVKNFKTINDADFEEPTGLSAVMRGYQKNGYKWLRTLENYGFGGILADDMGLGKTLQMIAVLLAAKEEGKEGCSLIVCPSSLVYNWEEELHKFAPQIRVLTITGSQEQRQEKLKDWQQYDVLVTSYDLLKRDILYYDNMEFNYEVIDEAQYIKNHSTAAAKAVKVIKSRMRFALTGTPIENRLSELWSIFDYLMQGFLYGYDVFKKEFETAIVKNGDEEAMRRLQRMTGPFILRRLKKEVLKDLPDKLEEIRYVQLEETQRKVYDAQVVHMQTRIARQDNEEFIRNKLQMLAELTRLRQICCDPSLCFDNYKGESAKREACLELVQSAIDGGHKILLFSQFTSMLDILRSSLDEAGISYYTITGETSKEQRLKLVKAFNEDNTPLFLISLKAGGVGLNLTGADVVIHYDPWWNLAAQDQATDRAHRIGQVKKVTVYKLIVKNTVEEKILQLQDTKRSLADSIVNAQTGQLAALSREEFMELLAI